MVLVLDNRSETVKVIVIYQSDVAVCLGKLRYTDVYWNENKPVRSLLKETGDPRDRVVL